MATDIAEIDKKNRRDYLKIAISVITCAPAGHARATEPSAFVAFRPIVDGGVTGSSLALGFKRGADFFFTAFGRITYAIASPMTSVPSCRSDNLPSPGGFLGQCS